MRHYYYHGFEPYYLDHEAIDFMIEIINSGGIKKRKEVFGEEEPDQNSNLNHICLYRKNENYDYGNRKILESARSGWIDNCMVFVISDSINAKYIPPNTQMEGMGLPTNLVDEWRCFENIPLDKIVGIAIPLDSLKNALDGNDRFLSPEDVGKLRESLRMLREICRQIGLKVYNSEKKDFTDLLDAQIESSRNEQEEEIMI